MSAACSSPSQRCSPMPHSKRHMRYEMYSVDLYVIPPDTGTIWPIVHPCMHNMCKNGLPGVRRGSCHCSAGWHQCHHYIIWPDRLWQDSYHDRCAFADSLHCLQTKPEHSLCTLSVFAGSLLALTYIPLSMALNCSQTEVMHTAGNTKEGAPLEEQGILPRAINQVQDVPNALQ